MGATSDPRLREGAPPIVRRALPEDAERLARIHVASWREAYRGLLPDELLDQLTVARRERQWRHLLGRTEGSTLLAERGGEAVGFVALGAPRDADLAAQGGVGEVHAIYLLASAWGCGYGRMLWEAALAGLRDRGDREVALWVLEANERARGFYERMGLAADGWRKSERMGPALLEEVRYRGGLEPPD